MSSLSLRIIPPWISLPARATLRYPNGDVSILIYWSGNHFVSAWFPIPKLFLGVHFSSLVRILFCVHPQFTHAVLPIIASSHLSALWASAAPSYDTQMLHSIPSRMPKIPSPHAVRILARVYHINKKPLPLSSSTTHSLLRTYTGSLSRHRMGRYFRLAQIPVNSGRITWIIRGSWEYARNLFHSSRW